MIRRRMIQEGVGICETAVRKRTAWFFVGALLLLLGSPTAAYAEYKVPVSNAHVMVLQDSGGCSAHLFGVFAFASSDVNVFLLANGQQVSVCTFDDIGVHPRTAQVLRDFPCFTSFGMATTTSATLAPTGRMTFRCLTRP